MQAKRAIAFILILLGLSFCKKKSVLPLTEKLKELPLEKVLSLNSEQVPLASISSVLWIEEKGLLFFENKTKTLYFADTEGDVKKMGKRGQGPGEYTTISDMYLKDRRFYLLDAANKLILLDEDFNFAREIKIPAGFHFLLGIKEDTYYLADVFFTEQDTSYLGVYRWREGEKKPLKLLTLHNVTFKVKQPYGEAVIIASRASVALTKKGFVAHSSYEYEITFYDLEGKSLSRLQFPGFKPSFGPPEPLVKFFDKHAKPFAIKKISKDGPKIAVFTNLWKGKNRRIDFFTEEGKHISSYLLPEESSPIRDYIWISNGHLIVFDEKEGKLDVFRYKI